jgi:GntR family transcriptional regulator, transcriptional repressor for pyruvate dehydrogenase complex
MVDVLWVRSGDGEARRALMANRSGPAVQASEQLAPTPKVKASLVLAREIVETMEQQGMRPGDRYLPEAQAIRHHGVARNTYREALRFLEYQGVIVVRSGPTGGPEITQPGWPHLASAIALILQFADAPLGSLLDARIAIEPGMAELAAANATAEEIEAMTVDLLAIESGIGKFRVFSQAYNNYWKRLAQSSHNPLLAFLSPALRAIVNSAGFVPNEPYRVETLARLNAIHGAVSAHDQPQAGRLMRDLEVEFRRRLTEGYPRQMRRSVAWSDLAWAAE